MVTIVEARTKIYELFLANYTALPAAQVTADNENFETPEGLPWGRLSVRHATRAQESLGGLGLRKFTSVGAAFFQVFVPKDQGVKQADELAQAARVIFEGVSIYGNDIRFTSCDIREAGPEDGWYGLVVEALFQYTETK